MPRPEADFILPDWPSPPQVRALVTTRSGGVSKVPYERFNLALHVGDAEEVVRRNRILLQAELGTPYEPQWLDQVHGIEVLEAAPGQAACAADAAVTGIKGLPCAVLTADCLPVFFCNSAATRVGIAHAGWRGLLGGVLEATLARMGVPASTLLCWLGPAIGPDWFEVGTEVRDAFVAQSPAAAGAFRANPARSGFWFADLYGLARQRLAVLGIEQVFGGGFCTYEDRERFYSYRRDNVTGRMASLIWLE